MVSIIQRSLFLLLGALTLPLLAQDLPSPPTAPAAPSSLKAKDPIPPQLKAWEQWATWDDAKKAITPPAYNDRNDRMPLWASQLDLTVTNSGGQFEVEARAYEPTWLMLPGDGDLWPQDVVVDGEPVSVIERSNRPATKLEPGVHKITGKFPWSETPQRLSIPPQIGVLTLKMNGKKVEVPNWDAAGFLWLKRARAAEAEREFLEAKVYRVLEDGIPMWLRTEIELSVAGKSREEVLGMVLPQAGGAWTIASVGSKLPCAVDDEGQVKVQVRAGKWSVRIDAFRSVPAKVVGYAEGANPIAEQEVVGFQAKSDFRVLELRKIQAVDVSQTTFPKEWRQLPVYRWENASPFELEEKMRGMGFQRPSGLQVRREFWLDDEGDLMTFRDKVTGQSQQDWRLDVSPGQKLGAVRMAGEGQLITTNPTSGAMGVEVRKRNLDFEAVGRIEDARHFPASGWEADVDSCNGTLHLPPGWRVFALFGAERVNGAWLTTWTLLDLFLLLVFSLSILKLWGWLPAIVAALGMGMTFHEPDAPLVAYFFLLIPVSILRVIPQGTARRWVQAWKYLAIGFLMIFLLPFLVKQVQGVLYPQLEKGTASSGSYYSGIVSRVPSGMSQREQKNSKFSKKANMRYDAQAQIQTGPAVPNWTWRQVTFGWRGPVTPVETVRVMLIPPMMQRLITIARVVMLILLVAILLESKRFLPEFLRGRPNPTIKLPPKIPPTATALFLITAMIMSGGGDAHAQTFPSKEMLQTLRNRLVAENDAFSPLAAEIPKVAVTLGDRTLKMKAEIHAATLTAVPLPGKVAAWSPVSVRVDGKPAEAVMRRKGYLWVVLEKGTHQVEVEGLLPNVTEWEWAFLLKPRRVEVDAPGWTVTGVKPTGVPENEVFFAVKVPAVATEAAYDRKDFNPAVLVEREIEVGLVWQVRTTLKRLSPGGKAVALAIPLLPGERVLSSNFAVSDGKLRARLGTGDESVSWESELRQDEKLTLEASSAGRWVERWRLIASPVWNVSFLGLPPIYEMGGGEVQPVWRPWPSESAELTFSKPEAIPGATMTLRGVEHETSVGLRQRKSSLRLNLQASLGQEFALDLDPAAEVTALKIQKKQQPVRRDGSQVIIPVSPGEQMIELEWKTSRKIAMREAVDRLVLPVESSNISTSLSLPGDRWVLWADGPLRGPAVRFWALLVVSIIGAFVLGRLKNSPLGGAEWGLLALGLTQVHPVAALLVVAWFFLLAWRGSAHGKSLTPVPFNFLQVAIALGLLPVVGILLFALHRGLLGTPEMMVSGNGSTSTSLRWFAQRADGALPEAGAITVSIWFYRLLMLAWALWLAAAALRWVRWGWTQVAGEPVFKSGVAKVVSKPGSGD